MCDSTVDLAGVTPDRLYKILADLPESGPIYFDGLEHHPSSTEFCKQFMLYVPKFDRICVHSCAGPIPFAKWIEQEAIVPELFYFILKDTTHLCIILDNIENSTLYLLLRTVLPIYYKNLEWSHYRFDMHFTSSYAILNSPTVLHCTHLPYLADILYFISTRAGLEWERNIGDLVAKIFLKNYRQIVTLDTYAESHPVAAEPFNYYEMIWRGLVSSFIILYMSMAIYNIAVSVHRLLF